MILALDIGNTNVVLAAMQDGKVTHNFRLQSDLKKTTDEYAVSILSLINYHKLDLAQVNCVMASSVVPPLTQVFSRIVNKYFNMEPVIITTESDHRLEIQLDLPSSLGTDRLMTAVAAHNIYKTNCITVDYGTANTIEAVTKNGEFLGGIIFPGPKLASEALHANTAQLPRVDIARTEKVIGTSTKECIQSGLYYGYLELIDGLIDRIIKERFEGEDVVVLATGGLGSIFTDESRHNIKYEANLIMYGLQIMYDRIIEKNPNFSSPKNQK